MYVYKAQELSLLAAVRTAIAEERLAINLPSKSNAIQMRAQVYAFAKKLRKLAEAGDVTLVEVVSELDQVMIGIEENVLVLQRRDATDGMKAVNAALKAKGVKIRDPNMEAYKESEKRLAERLQEKTKGPEEGGPRVTPYYTRED